MVASPTLIAQTNFRRFTLSARMPAGRVNKKKGSDATVAISEIKTGESVRRFIIHVDASLWAVTQVPEITVAIQSLLKAGFRRALQVEVLVIIHYRGDLLSQFHYCCQICVNREWTRIDPPTESLRRDRLQIYAD